MRRALNATWLTTSLAASLAISLLALLPASAAPAHDFPITGKVLDAYAGPARTNVYKLETESSIYKLLCVRHLVLGTIPAKCSLNGNPLRIGDEIHLRTDGKTVTFDTGHGKEQSLSILLEETKLLPPLPTPTAAGEEGAVLLAHGLELMQEDFPQSTPIPPPAAASGPVMPTGPVLAIPVTGGPPVPVIASGPVTGGIVTGVSATGQPVTAIAVGPVSSPSPSAPPLPNPAPSGPQSRWTSVLYLETASRIYKIQCEAISCISAARKFDLGDPVIARVEAKWVCLSPPPSGQSGKTKESKWRILSVSGTDEPPSSQF